MKGSKTILVVKNHFPANVFVISDMLGGHQAPPGANREGITLLNEREGVVTH